jgi:hypothetical protein
VPAGVRAVEGAAAETTKKPEDTGLEVQNDQSTAVAPGPAGPSVATLAVS